jgi:mono/diheme cytochrome c family protein
MPSSLRRWLALLGAVLLVALPAVRAADPAPVEFNRGIRPILSDNCFSCHGPDRAKRKAKLRLDTEEGAFADLGGRRALVPGDPARSELIARVTAEDETERMPPPASGRKLTPHQIELLRRWVEQGARWQKHWAFLPPRRPELPAVRNEQWVRNPIDAFVLARLEREGLAPSLEPEKTTLIRRVSLDLTGLPPTPAEVDAFLADASPDAYEKLVDRLLASPRYGEHMAVEWLDAARYADTNGYQGDNTRTLWPWRDWLINALNRNMPFDQFTVEQIAGDLLPGATREQRIATGLQRNHMINGEGGRIAEESRVDYVVDRVDTTATVWLGLTLGCCRCHDHKYDPFTQKEYYQLFAYFNNVAESGGVDRGGNAAPVLALPTEDQTKRQAELTKAVSEQDRELKKIDGKHPPTPEQWQRQAVAGLARTPVPLAAILALPDNVLTSLPEREPIFKKRDEARKALDAVNRSIVQTMVMEERQPPRETFVLIRGQYDKYGEKVGPGVPALLAPLPDGAPGNRLGLAKWLVDPANPLTARVTVNRAWQHFFGTGLVKTTEDFGVQGEAPSHLELLDWLAVEFRESGWDVKALHRRIVTSATYRQASRLTPALRERDPDNRLLARGPRLRLSSFALRDQALAVSGLLVEKVGGPPVKPYQPPGIWEEMSFGKTKYVQDHGEGLYRRSLYTFWRRAVPPTTMFDTASRQVCTVRPSRTNTPLHALILLNDVTFVEAARVLAQRLLTERGNDEERITLLFRLATARKPGDTEMQVMTQALERLRKQYGADRDAALKLVSTGEAPRKTDFDVVEHAAYTGLASMVLNLDEAISKE